jgi:hypothetical protein
MRHYDPWANLEKIKVPVLAVNSAEGTRTRAAIWHQLRVERLRASAH